MAVIIIILLGLLAVIVGIPLVLYVLMLQVIVFALCSRMLTAQTYEYIPLWLRNQTRNTEKQDQRWELISSLQLKMQNGEQFTEQEKRRIRALYAEMYVLK